MEIKFNWIQFKTTLLLMLTRAAITDITLPRRCTCKICIVDCKIRNLRILPMTLSTWILTFEIFRELSTPFPEVCDFWWWLSGWGGERNVHYRLTRRDKLSETWEQRKKYAELIILLMHKGWHFRPTSVRSKWRHI